jgi:enoyl-CoA hydratase
MHCTRSVRWRQLVDTNSGCGPWCRVGTIRFMMESTACDDDQRHPHGEVRVDVVDDHILVLTVDRVEKKNAFTPKITSELEDALTRLDEDPDLFVGVLTFAGDHTTAGLEMPLFFTEDARQAAAARRAERASEPVDPFSLGRRLTKPRITAVQGITFTIGIEIALGGDIVVAASDLRMCQLEPKRGLAPLGGATVRYVQRAGWGNAMYHLLRADEFGADEAYRIGLVQEVVEPGRQRDRAIELARELLQCSPTALRHTIANARVALDENEPAAIAAIPAMDKIVQATEDFREGIASFVERRPAKFTGR